MRPSEIALKYATLFAHSMPSDDCFQGEVSFIAQEIDAAAREIARPLVEALLKFESTGQFDDLCAAVDEAKKLKGAGDGPTRPTPQD